MKRGYKVTLTSLKTGKRYEFKSGHDASYFLGRAKSYVSTSIYKGYPISRRDTGELFVASFPDEEKSFATPKQRRTLEQPCCTCRKFCGGCSWSKDFTPVDGWKAIPTIIHHGDNRDIPSFKIMFCPKYERG